MIYVINLAVKKDKKVECDTLFTEERPSQEMVEEIAQKLDAEVIISTVGRFIPFDDDQQKQLFFKQLKEVQNDE